MSDTGHTSRFDLSKLEDSYEIQSELHGGAGTATYLARHRPMGRDVTVTVLHASSPAEHNALTHLAADARLLEGMRHPNVVPIIETRWLAPDTLMIARARVRGTTLRQTLAAAGEMSEARTVEVLRSIGDVLQWAASGGVVHRSVTPDCICFQQGSGRVLLTFGLPAKLEGKGAASADDAAFRFQRCADASTLGRLGFEMLTARRGELATVGALRSARPDVSPHVLHAIEEGLRCNASAPTIDAPRFLALLGGPPSPSEYARIATASSAPVVPLGSTAPVREPSMPLAQPAAIPETRSAPPPVERTRRGGPLLFLSMLALIAVIGTTFALIRRERGGDDARVVAGNERRSSTGDVDVEQEPLPPDPSMMTGGSGTIVRQQPALPPTPPIVNAPVAPGVELPQAPVVTAPVVTAPVVTAPVVTAPPSGTVAAAPSDAPGGNVCDSPAGQRECLTQQLALRDRELNSVYRALLAEVTARGGGETAAADLRARQRDWLARRDRACQRAGTGELWARARAECLGDQSDARALELARDLARVRSMP